jgi:hypothetical protein
MSGWRYPDHMGRPQVFVLVAALIWTAAPVGDGHGLPRVALHVGERSQRGRLTSHSWHTGPIPPCIGCPPEDVYCGSGHADPVEDRGIPPRRVPSGWHTGYVALARPDPPDELAIRRSTKRGAADIPFTLRPQEQGGQVSGWLAEITFRIRKHLYVVVTGEWREEEDTDECPERLEASWAFHLATQRA